MFVVGYDDWMKSASERFIFCKKLLENSKNDPVYAPYCSKYQASTVLKQLCKEIEEKWISYEIPQIKFLYGLFHYKIGSIALETEERSAGCDALNISLEYLKGLSNIPDGCYILMKVLNKLGILWCDRGENDKALDYFLQAESAYNNYMSSRDTYPNSFEDIFMFGIDIVRNWPCFEKTFTYTLYYLAQMYGQAEENEKAAKYCHRTLKRQRESGDFDELEWAMNCATLSRCYVGKKHFEEARHLLCTASSTLMNKKSKLNQSEIETDEQESVREELQRIEASISSLWINYSISILEHHHNLLSESNAPPDVQSTYRLTNDENIVQMENEIPFRVSTFEEAKKIFLFAGNHINIAKQYYTLNEFASEHVQIIQNYSSLYKNLAYYESDINRKCKMFKRRLDMLENVLEKINPNFYLYLCRQLQFELGEICFEMMNSKFKLLSTYTNNQHFSAVKKINLLITKGIDYFNRFLESFKDKNGKFPETFPEDDVRPILIAYFYIGRFYTKLIENDADRMLYNLSKSEECYKFTVNYIEKNPNHLNYFEEEFSVVKEMIEFMPQRMLEVTDVA